jgi:hypothetical protein
MFPVKMITLPDSATDDELRAAVIRWFTLVGSGAIEEASDYLDSDSHYAMTLEQFVARVAEFTSGGTVSIPEPILSDSDMDVLPIDGPIDLVYHWIPGSEATEKHPGFVAEILHTIPVDGSWSLIDASFFVRRHYKQFTLQLRDVIRQSDK